MKTNQLMTVLACVLALTGCFKVQDPLGDSSVDPDEGSGGTRAGTGGDGWPVRGEDHGGAGYGGSGASEGTAGGAGETGQGGTGGSGYFDAGEGVQAGTGGWYGNTDGQGGTGGSYGYVRDSGTAAPTEPDAGTQSNPKFGTRSLDCERVEDAELCLGEGWMLAPGENLPACGESGAYRVCTFADGECVSHTLMMVQRCE